jgi:ParB/RepB/Spo0J family partition protein
MAESQLKKLAITAIRTNPVALRELQREDEKYQSLVVDIGKRGVLLPITVMEKKDEATDEVFYQIVDGLHRYSAAADAGLEVIPANILDITDEEVVETQIVGNLLRVDTKPIEYTQALLRMLASNPTMTLSDLAAKISQSSTYVSQRLSLLKLDETIQELVNNKSICVTNAIALSKLPKDEQHDWTDKAQVQQPSEFVPAVTQRQKELAEAKRAGKAAAPAEFVAQARLRKLSELKDENGAAEIGPALTAQFGVTTAAEGFALAIAWALNLDPTSVSAGKAKWQEAKSARDEERKKNAAAREAKRAQEAAAKAEKAKADSGLSDAEIEAQVAELKAAEAAKKAEATPVA